MRLSCLALLLAVSCNSKFTPGQSTSVTDSHTWDTGDGDSGDSGETGDTTETGDTSDTGGDTGGDTGLYATAFADIRTAVATDLDANYASGASVAIWYQGEIIFAEGFGTRNPDTDEAVAPTTLFQIGSDTKKLTAIALLQQVDAGTTSLDDTLTEALPDLSFASDPTMSDHITVHQIISHQSDIFDYTPWDDAPDDSELADRTYGRFAENEFAYAPGGSYWNYANPNFSLAGLIAQNAAGVDYPDLVEENVFAPMGLERTFSRLTEVVADGDYATGYGISFPDGYDTFSVFGETPAYSLGTVPMEDQVDNAFIRPAGLVWSTASDMCRIAAWLIHGDEAVLPDALREQITTAQVPLYPTIPGQSYGYGMMVLDGFSLGSDWIDAPLWLHGGNTMAMTSSFYILPDQDFAISILSNGYGDDFSNTLYAALSEIPELPVGTAPTYPPPADLESYVGTWYDPNTLGEVDITYDGTNLNISIPTLTDAGHTVKSTLEADYLDMFTVKIDRTPYDLTFVDGEDGTPHKYLRNRSFGAIRTDTTSAMAPPRRPPGPGPLFVTDGPHLSRVIRPR